MTEQQAASGTPRQRRRPRTAGAAAAADEAAAATATTAGGTAAVGNNKTLDLRTIVIRSTVLGTVAFCAVNLAVHAVLPDPTSNLIRSQHAETDGEGGERGGRRLLQKLRGGGGGSSSEGNPRVSLSRYPFPQSVHDDYYSHDGHIQQHQFEPIQHPVYEYLSSPINNDNGNKDSGNARREDRLMVVPKFWDPPEFGPYGGVREYLGGYGRRLMTKDEALSVGSKIPMPSKAEAKDGDRPKDGTAGEAKEEKREQQHEEEEGELETIVVALASFRDWMCPLTVENLFDRAAHPERLRVTIVDQIYPDKDTKCTEPLVPCRDDPNQALCRYGDHVDGFTVDASLANGPVFGRHLGYRMYRGEYFFLQCDAHVQFVQHWDVDVIDQWKAANNEMAVLTTYVSQVQEHVDETTGERLSDARPIMCDSYFEGDGTDSHMRHGEMPDYKADFVGEPQLEPYWAAGFSFSRGHFVVNVPYDQHLPLVFQGEEISIGVRGFTYGYDYYAPERNVIFHYYDRPKNPHASGRMAKEGEGGKGGGTVPKYWDMDNWNDDVEVTAMMRLNGIIHMNPPDVTPDMWRHDDERTYGIGEVRTPELFYDTFGIHVDERTVEGNLCMFVATPAMHKWFVKRLREDGMGVDYGRLGGFRFRDQWPKADWWWYHGEDPEDDDAEEEEEEGDDGEGDDGEEEEGDDEGDDGEDEDQESRGDNDEEGDDGEGGDGD